MNQPADSFTAAAQAEPAAARKRSGRERFAYLCSLVFLSVGIASLAAAGYLYWAHSRVPDSDRPSLTVEDSQRTFEGVVVGRDYEVEYHIVNDAAQPRRVIGSEFS